MAADTTGGRIASGFNPNFVMYNLVFGSGKATDTPVTTEWVHEKLHDCGYELDPEVIRGTLGGWEQKGMLRREGAGYARNAGIRAI